ncbi:MAG: N-acetyl sugar amidotransferase [Gammaproteobacteria bacterium]|nr:N-acetyl sugar amidotransferase [Gammaproteobacteria bacterium]
MPLETKYGLPAKVIFCQRCVTSNQRPTSSIEFQHQKNSKKNTLNIDVHGVCDACHQAEIKTKIDWQQRETELVKLLDQYRRNDGQYDCLIPGSGGKDSGYQAHILKHQYGMNPLTITWPPILYTDYGYQNWKNWIEVGGFDNLTFKPNGRVMKLLTKLSIENILHPFQTFILGQKNLAPKIAAQMNIDLIFYGESEAEYGNPIAENASSLRDQSYYMTQNLDNLYLAGLSLKELQEVHHLTLKDLMIFLPATVEMLKQRPIAVHYLGYYLPWVPQEAYYYAVENTGFKARPFRTQGTYSKYDSIDDKIDDLHYYTTFIKFGIGRATFDASQEIRNNHILRDEGVKLVEKFDGEFPDKYFKEIMDYIDLQPERFIELCDQARSPHLWVKVANEWRLRHNVGGTGVDDVSNTTRYAHGT